MTNLSVRDMLYEDLFAALEEINQKPVVRAASGVNTGHHFTLWIGSIMDVETGAGPRQRGEYSIYVRCSWRLNRPSELVRTWRDAEERGDAMDRDLRLLTATHVTSFRLAPRTLDLALDFGATELSIFADAPSGEDQDYCYFVSTPRHKYLIRTGGLIEAKPRFDA